MFDKTSVTIRAGVGRIEWLYGRATFNPRKLEICDQNKNEKKELDAVSDTIPDKVVYNGDTTIVMKDNKKHIIKCNKGDKFDPVFGFLYGYFLVNSGMSKTQAAKFFDNFRDIKK